MSAPTNIGFRAFAAAASTRISGVIVLLLALACVALVETRCGRSSHLRCVTEVVPALMGAVVVALLLAAAIGGGLPSSVEALLSAAPRSDAPSSQAAALAAATAVLTGAYGWRAGVMWLAALACAGAQLGAGQHSAAEIVQGWLVGGGCGMLVYALFRRVGQRPGVEHRE